MNIELAQIIEIVATMVLSAFFAGMEIAFVSSNRMLAEMDKDKNRNDISQILISYFYRHPNGFVSTMLVGNNIVLVMYGILFANIFDNTLFADFDAGARVTLDTIFCRKCCLRPALTDCLHCLHLWQQCFMCCCGPSASLRLSCRV